jgi:uncharacterized membrane protein YeaQ/YmgE (transglycosylase-associated protein family)
LLDNILALLIVGAIAGWLASLVMKNKGLSLGGYLVLGILGAIVGGFVLGLLQLHASGLIGSIISATVGAMIVIWLVQAIWRKKG